jgi:hypothetical protein
MDPTKKELYTAKRASGLNTSDPDLLQEMQQLKCDPSHNWMLVRIVDNTAVLHACGGGGLKAFSDHLTDDDIYYGALRCLVDEKVKFFHVYFVGQSVSAMKKGKASLSKQAIFNLVEAHGELSFSSGLAEYSDSLVIQAIQSLTKSTNIVI